MKLYSAPKSAFAALLLSISCISPVAEAVSSASTLFKIPTGSTPGSCDPYKLDQVISDASNMAQAAITAISNYQKQSVFSAPAPGVLATYNAAWSMFGAPGKYSSFANRVVITSSGTAILNNVKQNYQNVIDLLQSTSTLRSGKAIVACDDTFLTWVTQLQDIVPNAKGTSQGEQTLLSVYAEGGTTFPSNVKGFYYSTFNNGKLLLQDEQILTPAGQPGGALCTQRTADAETWASYGFMLLCPRMFQLPANVATVVGSLGGTPLGTNINVFKTAAGAFLHEMMHFLATDTANGGKIGDQQVLDDNAYTWEPCALLGTNQAELALLNADNYHYFAVASSLGSVNFGTEGIAQ